VGVGGLVGALTTSTTIANPHLGAPLPAARVVVLAIPLLAIGIFWFLAARRRAE
jgi:hypothetical protein